MGINGDEKLKEVIVVRWFGRALHLHKQAPALSKLEWKAFSIYKDEY
jgi:hypothetical protein